MKKAAILIPAAAIIICLLAGCTAQPEPEPEPGPVPEPAPAATPEPTPTPVTYQTAAVTNASPYDIKELWIVHLDFFEELGVYQPLFDLGGVTGDVLKKDDSIDAVIVSLPGGGYDITMVDEDDDVFRFSGVALTDGAEMALSWDKDRYIAELFDASGAPSATYESVADEDNREAGERPGAKFDSQVILGDIDMLIHYPSKVFRLFDADSHFVELKSKDGNALLEVRVNEPWDGPDRGAMNTGIRTYEGIAKEIINEKMQDATDIEWYETDIVRTDYEGISNLLYIYSKADYTLGGQPMHTICMVNRWYRISDFAPYLFTITLTTTAETLDFYMDNYYYRISDSLTDR